MATKGNALNRFRAKKRRLLKLYFLWTKTHKEDVRQECLSILHDILEINPYYKFKEEFDEALA